MLVQSISKTVYLDSAHQLCLPYESKCNNLHGHRWEITVVLAIGVSEETPSLDMIIDFNDLKKFFDKYDHVFLNDVVPSGLHTTAENLSRFFCKEVRNLYVENFDKLAAKKGVLAHLMEVSVSVKETPSSVAVSKLVS